MTSFSSGSHPVYDPQGLTVGRSLSHRCCGKGDLLGALGWKGIILLKEKLEISAASLDAGKLQQRQACILRRIQVQTRTVLRRNQNRPLLSGNIGLGVAGSALLTVTSEGMC